MKTKAEILEEFGCPTPDYTETVTMFYPSINEAMDEYAKQQAQDFAEWISNNLYRRVDSDFGLVWRNGGIDAYPTSELYTKFNEERSKQ